MLLGNMFNYTNTSDTLTDSNTNLWGRVFAIDFIFVIK